MKCCLKHIFRTLAALAVCTVWLVLPSKAMQPDRWAAPPTVDQSVAMAEPQIPEQHLMLAQRRSKAVERASHTRLWEGDASLHEATLAHQKQARQEQAARRKQLEEVADLVPQGYRRLVLDVSRQFQVDPRLLAAVGTVESRWHPWALGSSGDSGLMQILPETAAWIAGRMGLTSYDLFDPRTNLSMGAWYLQQLRAEHGTWERALAAYNGGPRAAGLGADHPYVGRVMLAYEQQGSNTTYVEPFSRGDAQ